MSLTRLRINSARICINSVRSYGYIRPCINNPSLLPSSTTGSSSCHLVNSIRSLSSTGTRFRSIPPGYILKPFLLADIGEGITGCEIVKWLVEPDQEVGEFDPICEVQSDKATVEITSPFEGKIHRLSGAAGEVIKVGQPLCEIAVKEEANDIVAPSPSIDMSVMESTADMVKPTSFKDPQTRLVHSTPAVRRLAKEHSIDIGTIVGTGKDERVTKEDVLLHLSRTSPSPSPTSSESTGPSPGPSSLSTSAETVRVPFNAIRQAMFRSMSNSLKIPHFGYSEQIDVTELERIRLELNQVPSETTTQGRRVTLFSLLVKAMGYALRSEPVFRSTLGEAHCFLQRQSVDISIALSSPQGLLTPLIPNVEQKTVFEIAEHVRQLREFVESCSDETRVPVFPKELGGNRTGTFTLSNIGVIGGTYTHPVIPPTGQLAIGAFGKVQVLPRYRPSDMSTVTAIARGLSRDLPPQPEPRMILSTSFTADHRAIEGVELARLVQRFKEICERPSNMIGLAT